MHFASPLWLIALALAPVLVWMARRRRRAPGPAFPVSDAAAATPHTWAARLRGLPAALRIGAFALGVLALARPQRTEAAVAREAEGIDIVLALDASSSMEAPDFFPTRYEAAREVAGAFIADRPDDRIGLVVFAGEAFTAAPLTLDHEFVLRVLAPPRGEITRGMADGTAIGTALATATARLRPASTDDERRGRVVVLLTDGENNAGAVDPSTAAEAASALGVRVYAVGVGAEASPFGPAPGRSGGVDESALRQVAETTGGRFFRATDAGALRRIYDEISQLERTRVRATPTTAVEDRFMLLLWPAVALLLLDIALATTRLRRVPG
jgi:Ca-activated chloride channel family protein